MEFLTRIIEFQCYLTVPNGFSKHHIKFEIDWTILTCLKELTVSDTKFTKASLIKDMHLQRMHQHTLA